MPAKNTLIQLLAQYIPTESQNAQRHRQTDGRTDRQTDGRTDGQQAYANIRSYCVAVRSAKNQNVLSFGRKLLYLMSSSRKCTGRLFQTRGPASVAKHDVCAWNSTRSVGGRAEPTSWTFRNEVYVVSQVQRCLAGQRRVNETCH